MRVWHVSYWSRTCIWGKTSPDMKLQSQFTTVAILMAYGRAAWSNSSAVINQGIEPGPIANEMINNTRDTILRYLAQLCVSCNIKDGLTRRTVWVSWIYTRASRTNNNTSIVSNCQPLPGVVYTIWYQSERGQLSNQNVKATTYIEVTILYLWFWYDASAL